MSAYNPPTENVAIFDSAYFSAGDENITQNQADKRYLRYPTAQGKETLQAIDVNGLATFTNKTIMTRPSTVNDSILEITSTGNVNSNGIKLTNSGIVQTGAQIINVTNQFGPTKIIAGCALSVDKAASVVFEAQPVGGVNPQQYNINSNVSNLRLTSRTGVVDSTVIDISCNNVIKFAIPADASYSMPATNDSSQRIPSTAWVQSAIAAGGASNLTKNSYTVSPTSNALMYTTGLFNTYGTGGYYSYTSTKSVSFGAGIGWVTDNPLRINIQTANGTFPYNSNPPFTPTFSPLIKPIKVSLNCFVYNISGSTAYTRCTLLLLPSCMFGDSIGNSFWGRTGNSVGSVAYYLDNRINGNTAFINNDATYCPWPASVTGTPNVTPNNTGRQYYSYDYSSSTNITVLGTTLFSGGRTSVNIWFGGIGSGGADTDITYCISAKIEDASGATISPSFCGVYLSS